MSEFGKQLFSGSPLIRWTVGPIAILAGAAFALLESDWRGLRLILFIALELALVLLALVAFEPRRFRRTGIRRVLVAFVEELVHEPRSFWPPTRISGATGFNAVAGLLIISYPALKYAALGRFTWRAEETNDGSRTP